MTPTLTLERRDTGTTMLFVDAEKLARHAKRVCAPNLRRNAKICQVCPFEKDMRQYTGIKREEEK